MDMKLPTQRTQLGFSLTELLVVIALMGFLAAASVPAMSALNGSGRINQTVSEVAGLLEQSRQYAIAQNTYVWVAFHEDTNASGVNTVTVAVMASKDGTNPTAVTPGYNFGTIPSATALVNMICPLRTFSQVTLKDAGTITSSTISKLPTVPLNSNDNSLARSAASFTIKIPGATSAVNFVRYVLFTPSGEARNYANTIDVLEIGMQPLKGTGTNQTDNNVAVLRISGLTGLTQVYRP